MNHNVASRAVVMGRDGPRDGRLEIFCTSVRQFETVTQYHECPPMPGTFSAISLHLLPHPGYHEAWLRQRNWSLKIRLPPWRMRTRKPSPPLTKVSTTPKRVEPCPRKKSASACPSGLPPPLHAKGAERSRRNHRPHCRGRRRGSPPALEALCWTTLIYSLVFRAWVASSENDRRYESCCIARF